MIYGWNNFYVVDCDTKEIKNIYVFVPEVIYDDLKDVLSGNNTKEQYKRILDVYGENWELIFTPKAVEHGKGGLDRSDRSSKEPMVVNEWGLPWADEVVFGPNWHDGVDHYELQVHVYLVRMTIWLTDNLNTIRSKIKAAVGFGVFQQSLSYRESGEIVSDVNISFSGNVTIMNPFKARKLGESDHIIENVKAHPVNNWVYLITFANYYTDLIINKHIKPIFAEDIVPVFPQMNKFIFETVAYSIGTPFVHTNDAFPFTVDLELEMQSERNRTLTDVLEKPVDYYDHISLNEATDLLRFDVNSDIMPRTLDISKLCKDINNTVRHYHAQIMGDSVSTHKTHGDIPKKIRGLREMARPQNTINYSWVHYLYMTNKINHVGFINWNGEGRYVFKFKDDADISFDEAIEICQTNISKFLPEYITEMVKFTGNNVYVLNLKFVWDKTIPVGAIMFRQIKGQLLKLQQKYLFDVISKADDELVIVLSYLMTGVRELRDANTFIKWHQPGPSQTHVTMVVRNNYTKLSFSCGKINWNQLPMVRRIIKYICDVIEKSHIIENIRDSDLMSIQSITSPSNNKSKMFKELDRIRYGFNNTGDGDGVENRIGRGNITDNNNYAQRCQMRHQPNLIFEDTLKELPPHIRNKIVAMPKIGKPNEFVYLICGDITAEKGQKSKSSSVLTFMAVHPDDYVDEHGNHFKMCLPCCRDKEPKSAARQEMRKMCMKTGMIPIDKSAQPKGAKDKIQQTLTKYENRSMYLNTTMKIIAGKDSRYTAFGPRRSFTEYSLLVEAIVTMLDISIPTLVDMINEYFENNDNTEVFLNNISINLNDGDENNLSLTFFMDSATNYAHFEMIMCALIWHIKNARVIVIEDGRTYSVMSLNIDDDVPIYLLYRVSMIVFVIYKDMNKTKINFQLSAADKMFQNFRSILMRQHTRDNLDVFNITAAISKIADIEYAYYREDDFSVFGIHVLYNNEEFYYPLPPNILDYKNIGTSYLEKSTSPVSFVTLPTALKFLAALKITVIKYMVSINKIYGIQLYTNKVLLIKGNVDLPDKALFVETIFDMRKIAHMSNLTVLNRIVDEKADAFMNEELGKQLAYPFYILLFINLAVKKNHKDIKLSDIHHIFAEILDDDEIVGKLHHIRHNDKFDEETKKYLIAAISYYDDPTKILMPYDFEGLKLHSNLTKLIMDVMDSKIKIVADADMSELLDRDNKSEDDLPLIESFKRDFPHMLAKLINNSMTGNLLHFANGKIMNIKDKTGVQISTIKNVEYFRVSR